MAYKDYQTHNQRSHYRINDLARIGMSLVPVEHEQAVIDDIVAGLNASSLARISSEIELAVDKIPAVQKEVAVALKAINKKIDVIAGAMGVQCEGAIREQPVNLSYGGCRTLSEQKFEQGDGVEVSLILANSQRLRMFARVVHVKALSGQRLGQYEVAVQFQAMSDRAADLLKSYMELRQRQLLRKKLRR